MFGQGDTRGMSQAIGCALAIAVILAMFAGGLLMSCGQWLVNHFH